MPRFLAPAGCVAALAALAAPVRGARLHVQQGLRAAAGAFPLDMSCASLGECPFSSSELCDPAGFNTGGAAVELISYLNCSAWTQNVEEWPPTANDGKGYEDWLDTTLPAFGAYNRTPYVLVDNPAGVRRTTMTVSWVCVSRIACRLAPPLTIITLHSHLLVRLAGSVLLDHRRLSPE
jgi:hypothetical protein